MTDRELIRKAVDEHGVRHRNVKRKSSVVTRYSYKEPVKHKPKKYKEAVIHVEPLSPFDLFYLGLSDEDRPHAERYFQMECQHTGEEEVSNTSSYVEGVEPRMLLCPRCGITRTWKGTKTATLRSEWDQHCPEGFDAWEWQELYTKDRSFWRFIYDEAEFSLIEGLTKED